jgi:hypothetical protein
LAEIENNKAISGGSHFCDLMHKAPVHRLPEEFNELLKSHSASTIIMNFSLVKTPVPGDLL